MPAQSAPLSRRADNSGKLAAPSVLVLPVSAGGPAAFVGAARPALRDMDAQLPMIQPQSLQDAAYQSPSVFFRRYPSYLIGSFAALALALATIGLYGLISYTVQQRTREIGIRVALGAVSGDIFQMVVKGRLASNISGDSLRDNCWVGADPVDGQRFVWGEAQRLGHVQRRSASVVDSGGSSLRGAGAQAMQVDPIVALRHE